MSLTDAPSPAKRRGARPSTVPLNRKIQFKVMISSEEKAMVDHLAATEGLSASDVVRLLLRKSTVLNESGDLARELHAERLLRQRYEAEIDCIGKVLMRTGVLTSERIASDGVGQALLSVEVLIRNRMKGKSR